MKTRIKIAVLAVFGMSFGAQAQDLISGGSNSWIFHTPDNGSTQLHIAPRKSDNTDWNWSKQTIFSNDGNITFTGDLQNKSTFAKILLGSQNGDGLSVFGSMGSGTPTNGLQDYGAYIGFNAFRDSNGNWKHLRTSTIGASRYTVGGDIATGLKGFSWDHTNSSGTNNITWNNIMNLDTSGNLNVKGNVKSSGFLLSNTYRNLSSDAMLMYDNNKITLGSGNPLQYVAIKSGGQDRIFVNKDGNVGIGIPNPSVKLHVNDGQVLIQPENNNESGILKINEYRGGSLLDFSEVGDAGFLKVGYYGLNGDRVEINGGVSNAGSAVVGYDDGNTKFKLASRGTSFIEGGGLAIGTNMVPTGFDFAVAGKTITEEVKVQLKRDWPDFVFENSYQLPTLTEVENHIKAKGHLKDIPSAKEVETNGFYLGEMDAKLLQKIEELTLYTIEQEKKINSQSKEIEVLKSQQERIDTLEKENKVLKILLEKVNRLEKLIEEK